MQLKKLTVIEPVANESSVREQVVEVLDWICCKTKKSDYLQSDNDSKFRNWELAKWCEEYKAKQIFSRLEKLTDNCFIESFNGTFRHKCLNIYYFENLSGAKWIYEVEKKLREFQQSRLVVADRLHGLIFIFFNHNRNSLHCIE